jgi:hypothetical protein
MVISFHGPTSMGGLISCGRWASLDAHIFIIFVAGAY